MSNENYLDTLKSRYDFHGGPWDRGSADSYYGRPRDPHWYPNGTYNPPEIRADEMTSVEIEAYHAGYDENEESGDKKDWG
jgi:hypothetical protein